jgi:hypothetical protein
MCAVLSIVIAGCPTSDSGTRTADAIDARHRDARQAAWSWLDGLEIDPVALTQRGVKGKKRLAEILSAYLYLLRYSTDASERSKPRGAGAASRVSQHAAL